MAKRASTEDLLAALRELGDGEAPTAQECRDDGEYGPKVYQRRFGTWNEALEAAGYVDGIRELNIPEDKLLDDLRAAGGDGVPTIADYQEDGNYNFDTYQRRFGTWNSALEAAGYDPAAEGRVWSLTRNEVVEQLRRAADEFGHAPSSYEIRTQTDYLGKATVLREFDTWHTALTVAGLVDEIPTYCDECETEFETRRAWKVHRARSHGSTHSYADAPKHNPGDGRHYLGGWRKTRQAALERDGYECKDCGLTDEEHRNRQGRGLHVHHIIRYRTFDDPESAHGLWNLLTLCWRCHADRHHVHRRESYEELAEELSETTE